MAKQEIPSSNEITDSHAYYRETSDPQLPANSSNYRNARDVKQSTTENTGSSEVQCYAKLA